MAIVGADQKADGFWLRISNSYNEHRGELQERKEGQLKARWQNLNGVVQKFSGCYKQASSVKQSGASENDVMAAAYEIYMKDEGRKRKGKEKIGETSSQNESFEVPAAYQERTDAIDKLARVKEEEVTTKELEILFKDTTEMSEEQYLVHKWFFSKN
ncbi:putative glutathione S-transferase [Sesbania bispinosa]|nr:putative glutathione S-transferase [Sesbania bispinosa]